MTNEYRNKKLRRSWSKERRAADKLRRERQRAHLVAYVPNPLKPEETKAMAEDETQVILYVRSSGDVWVKMWPMLNDLSRAAHESERRPRRQALLALVTRMISEGKLIRHRATNTLSLPPWLRGIKEDQQV